MPRRSGRYPWGSGDRPYQSVKSALKGKNRDEYFTSERIIPKGTKMFRTSTNPNEQFLNKSKYVTYLDPDRDLYKGGWIRYKDNKDTYEYQMTLKDDLKIPSRETFKETLKDVLDNNPDLFRQSIDNYWTMKIPENSSLRLRIITAEDGSLNSYFWKEFLNDAWDDMSHIPIKEQWRKIVATFGMSTELKESMVNELKSKGYNAMVDEASVGGGDNWAIEGVDPLIIFDSSVLEVDKVSPISSKEENKSLNNYQKWKTTARANNNW